MRGAPQNSSSRFEHLPRELVGGLGITERADDLDGREDHGEGALVGDARAQLAAEPDEAVGDAHVIERAGIFVEYAQPAQRAREHLCLTIQPREQRAKREREHQPVCVTRGLGALERLSRITTTDRIVVVCGEHLIDAMREALPELDEDNFLIEPAARNTAPAIALAAMWANHRFPGEVVGVFPSDHFIGAPDRFASAVELASDAAKLGHIVTLGMQPNRPETGYGYIKQGGAVDGAQGVHVVDAFVEKSDHERALEYLSAGGYLWNAGMFFFTPETLMGEVER